MEFEYVCIHIFSKIKVVKQFTVEEYNQHTDQYPQDTDKYKIMNRFNRNCYLVMVVPRYLYFIED